MKESCTVLVGSSSSSPGRLVHRLCCRMGGTRKGCKQRLKEGEEEREGKEEMGEDRVGEGKGRWETGRGKDKG